MRAAMLALLIVASGVVACAGFAAKEPAEQAVARFHTQLDAGTFEQIYDETDALFKGASSRTQFVTILRSIHDKLGTLVKTTQTGIYVREEVGTNPGSYISLTYETQYTSGKVVEKFNFKIDAGAVHMAGYNIDAAD